MYLTLTPKVQIELLWKLFSLSEAGLLLCLEIHRIIELEWLIILIIELEWLIKVQLSPHEEYP